MNKRQFDTQANYNLSVVMNETQLKADTLRVWEKRYDLPKPKRSKGGHRLYSELDIATIKWLRNRQKEGMTIGRAVKLWRQLEKNENDPFELYPLMVFLPNDDSKMAAEASLDELRALWVDACLAFEEKKAEEVLNFAYEHYSLEMTSVQVLQRGVAAIGDLWYEGKANVQQEHFASELAMRKVHALINDAPQKTHDKLVLIGCPEGELHTFSPTLLNLFLRYRGWQVINLGADVPFGDLKNTVERTTPDLVFYSAMQLHTAAELLPLAGYLNEVRIPFAFGGWVFSQIEHLHGKIAGEYIGADLFEGVGKIEQLLTDENELLAKDVRLYNQEAVAHFVQNQTKIESRVEELLFVDELPSAPIRDMRVVHSFVGKDIVAGLYFDEMGLVDNEIDWIVGLLSNLKIGNRYMSTYFKMYYQACEEILDEQGELILEWLKTTF